MATDTSATASQLQTEICKYLRDIEASARSEILPLTTDSTPSVPFSAASLSVSEIKLPKSKKTAIIVKVPYGTYHSNIRRFHSRYVNELEKKTKYQVIFIPFRKIIPKNFRRRGIKVRPASRRLTAVHDALLEDIVAPTEIVGKRIRMKSDGSKLIKVHLDPKDKQKDNMEERLETFSEAYKALTHKEAIFMFNNPVN